MSLGLTIYVVLFSVVISTFIIGYVLSERFPNYKFYKFWKKHIIGDVDMDEFN